MLVPVINEDSSEVEITPISTLSVLPTTTETMGPEGRNSMFSLPCVYHFDDIVIRDNKESLEKASISNLLAKMK